MKFNSFHFLKAKLVLIILAVHENFVAMFLRKWQYWAAMTTVFKEIDKVPQSFKDLRECQRSTVVIIINFSLFSGLESIKIENEIV